MASNGDNKLMHLQVSIDEGLITSREAIRILTDVAAKQQQQIQALEQEIFNRCGDLRERVATIEQASSRMPTRYR